MKMMLNPIIRREAKTSLRSWKMFLAIALYTLIISGAAIIFIKGVISGGYMGVDLRGLSILYAVLGFMQFAMTMIMVPALTAGSISGERERQTLDILLVTKMTTFSIVIGKLASSIGIFLLMMIATLPVFAIVFFFGGLSLFNLLIMEIYMVVVSVMAGSIAVFFSTFFKKTVSSIIFTYIILGIFCFGTLICTFIYIAYCNSSVDINPSMAAILLTNIVNPGVGFASIMDKQLGTNLVTSFFGYWIEFTPMAKILNNYFLIINIVINIIITSIFTVLSSLKLKSTNN